MLNKVDLSNTMSKDEYARLHTELKEQLCALQQKIREAQIPVVILFEGWGASGKGSRIADIITNWDPRGYKVHSIQSRTDVENRLAPMARYWQKIPEKGQIAVFDRSWYRDISIEFVDEHVPLKLWRERIKDITVFERQLSDNGYTVIKFFLHISKKEQHKRFKSLVSHKDTKWRISAEDITHHKKYKTYYTIFSDILEDTNYPHAPWHVIPSNDRRYCVIEIFSTIIRRIEQAICRKSLKETEAQSSALVLPPRYKMLKMPRLSEIDLSQTMGRDEYTEELEALQEKAAKLHNRLYRKKIPLIITYEGWDGAGKGGSIKRLARSLDPRGYEVIPIASPLPSEKNRHYLWRFWNVLPKSGHITIFDRTWYGRCLVERIEGFCSESDWKRSFNEITEFEEYLHRQGYIFVKFWFHIDKDEQLRRFNERTNTAEKQWKITDEDWRNREKWDAYEIAAQDVLDNTSTDFAPWTIIEGNNKLFARIRAVETVVKAIEKAL